MSHHPYLVLAIGGVLIAFTMVLQAHRTYQREKALIEMAARLGFRKIQDSSPPPNVSFKGTDFWQWTRLVNRFSGSIDGIGATVFDFERDNFRTTWRRTVIALRTQNAPSARGLGLATQRVGEWQWYYKAIGSFPGERLMSSADIEKNLRILIAEATASQA